MGLSKSKSEHTSKKIKQFFFFQNSFFQLFLTSCELYLSLAKVCKFTSALKTLFLFCFVFTFHFFALYHLIHVCPLSPNNSFLHTEIGTWGVVTNNRLLVEDPFKWAQMAI